MIHSDNLSNLATALAKLQAEVQNPKNTATNPFLKNHYAPLNDILTEVRPLLARHGLSIAQLPTGTDTVGVTTVLMHSSGEWIADSVSMSLHDEKGKSLAQVAGSIITYLRRYAVSAVLGIASEDDTDGNSPQKAPQSHSGHTSGDNGHNPEWEALKSEMSEVAKGLTEEHKKHYRERYHNLKKGDLKTFRELVDAMKVTATDDELATV